MTLSWRFHTLAHQAPMLSQEEERELARRACCGDGSATERLMASHFRFVLKLAQRYRASGVAMADLIQEGMVGLSLAARKFDPDAHDNRFSTYAMWWIRAAMQDHMVRSWSLVRVGTTNAQKALFLAVRKRLAEGAPAEEWAAALAARFKTPLAEVKALAARVTGRDLTLDAAEPGDGAWVERLPDPGPNPEEVALARSERRARVRSIAAAMAALDTRERLIIVRRHFSELKPSLDCLAKEMQLSKERVRVLEKKALDKLRVLLQPLVPS
ncbi:sigma-70 family RNA polymerase sigma factor [Magnetospirillum aberrantis]|uniref:Sigma-70 family RNA polymerase sigma factor n=1 Tax=Magnetospirillum aberrantis SpK TaxID=908842 RepID=A0A7C9QW58_9PROT|nr:sigma-70 family RNA polymerase sigma factor [Magnetospirillum aberrantis]NFV81962.1 sigma-70 family RNA polymerase sigma factor [Magnetospirillum aberrantis SpK]